HEKIIVFENEMQRLKETLNTSLGVIVTAIGILVGALALFVSRQIPESITTISPSLILSTGAFVAAFFAYIRSSVRKDGTLSKVLHLIFVIFVLGILSWLAVSSKQKGIPEDLRSVPVK